MGHWALVLSEAEVLGIGLIASPSSPPPPLSPIQTRLIASLPTPHSQSLNYFKATSTFATDTSLLTGSTAT
jgi:hypothetical protein